MERASRLLATTTTTVCTPCRLGIHSCCSTRIRACDCTEPGAVHLRDAAAAGRRYEGVASDEVLRGSRGA